MDPFKFAPQLEVHTVLTPSSKTNYICRVPKLDWPESLTERAIRRIMDFIQAYPNVIASGGLSKIGQRASIGHHKANRLLPVSAILETPTTCEDRHRECFCARSELLFALNLVMR